MLVFLQITAAQLDARFCECDHSLLGNGECNLECMNFDCGFD